MLPSVVDCRHHGHRLGVLLTPSSMDRHEFSKIATALKRVVLAVAASFGFEEFPLRVVLTSSDAESAIKIGVSFALGRNPDEHGMCYFHVTQAVNKTGQPPAQQR